MTSEFRDRILANKAIETKQNMDVEDWGDPEYNEAEHKDMIILNFGNTNYYEDNDETPITKKVLFVCTSNKDRSPALVKHFKKLYPKNEYRSAGLNKYHCEKKDTHYLLQSDLDWSNIVVFAQDVHKRICLQDFTNIPQCITLNCGEYIQGDVSNEYLQKAECKLNDILKENLNLN